MLSLAPTASASFRGGQVRCLIKKFELGKFCRKLVSRISFTNSFVPAVRKFVRAISTLQTSVMNQELMNQYTGNQGVATVDSIARPTLSKVGNMTGAMG